MPNGLKMHLEVTHRTCPNSTDLCSGDSPEAGIQGQVLPASKLVCQGIHLRAVPYSMLDHTPRLDRLSVDQSVPQAGVGVSSQHTEGGRLPRSVHTQQSKTLHREVYITRPVHDKNR